MKKIAADRNYRMFKRALEKVTRDEEKPGGHRYDKMPDVPRHGPWTDLHIEQVALYHQRHASHLCPSCGKSLSAWKKVTKEQALRDGYIHIYAGA